MSDEWKSAFIPNTSNISAVLVWIDDENAVYVDDMAVVGWRIDYIDGASRTSAEPVFLEDISGDFEDWFLVSGGAFYKPDVFSYETREEAIEKIRAGLISRRNFLNRLREEKRQKLDPPPTPTPSST